MRGDKLARAMRAVCAVVSLLLATSCGGGGGDGGGTAPGTSNPPASGFTLSATSVAFAAKRAKPAPPTQIVKVRVNDSRAASVGAAYVAPQTQPDWLSVGIAGSGQDFDLALSIINTNKTRGQYSAVLTVGTADPSGAVLSSQTIQITFTVQDAITVQTNSLATFFVLGHSTNTFATNIDIGADAATQWTISGSGAWITAASATGRGPASATVTLSAGDLDAGTHQGTLTISNNADPVDRVSIPVQITITEPSITLPGSTVVVGGDDGLAQGGISLPFSVHTGTNQHPWTATGTTNTGGQWIRLSAAAGQVGQSGSAVVIDADRSVVAPGSFGGQVTLHITVRGRTYTRTIPVAFNKEGHWLLVSSGGVAFSSLPARSVLTRTLTVASSQGLTNVPWDAASDASWLTVTPSGMTGGGLTLTADPGGLQADTQYFANVSISSSDPSIQNDETVRVGLWVGSQASVGTAIDGSFPNVVANPVEPWLYANNGGSAITVFDVYTAAIVRTLDTSVARAGEMTISHDGRVLFVTDDTNREVVAVDAATGADVRRYSFAPSSSYGLAYARPSARPLLVTGSGAVFDVETGERYSQRIDAGWYGGALRFSVDPLSRYVYTQNRGLSPSTLGRYGIRYTAVGTDRVRITGFPGNSGGSNGQDVCVSADGLRVYTANGWPYLFPAFRTDEMSQIQELPGEPYPNNAECGWNGLFFGGAAAYYSATNIWVYRSNGTQVATLNIDPAYLNNLMPNSLVLSGDNTRVMASTERPSLGFRDAPAP